MYSEEQLFDKLKNNIKRGDIIGAKGKIGRSKTGELSVAPHTLQLLSPCLHVIPKPTKDSEEILKDQETRYRQRYLDLICNKKPRDIFVTRS